MHDGLVSQVVFGPNDPPYVTLPLLSRPTIAIPPFSVALTIVTGPLVLRAGSAGAGEVVLNDDMDTAALEAVISQLHKPGYEIMGTSDTLDDGKFTMTLDMSGVRKYVRQLVLAGPSASFLAPAGKDHVFTTPKWSTCVRGHSNYIVGSFRRLVLVVFLSLSGYQVSGAQSLISAVSSRQLIPCSFPDELQLHHGRRLSDRCGDPGSRAQSGLVRGRLPSPPRS